MNRRRTFVMRIYSIIGIGTLAAMVGCGESPTDVTPTSAPRLQTQTTTSIPDADPGRGHGSPFAAKWRFEGNGDDQTGAHDCTLFGGATFVATPDGQGLHTADASSYAAYSPPIEMIEAGRIVCVFELDDDFAADPAFGDPIILINSNRSGHFNGDFSLRLDPSDGKMCWVQEQTASTTTQNLETTKETWAPGWYKVILRWGSDGRHMKVTWDGGNETVLDDVVLPCFSDAATETWIAARPGNAPGVGLTIERMDIRVDRHSQGGQGAGGELKELPRPRKGFEIPQ